MSSGIGARAAVHIACWVLLVQLVGSSHGLRPKLKHQGAAGDSGPTVRVREGILRGTRGKSVSGREFLSFLGIPYAKPPVGPLRFKGPQPANPWNGVRDATKEGATCHQAFGTKFIRVPFLNDHGPSAADYIKNMFEKPGEKRADLKVKVSSAVPNLFAAMNTADLRLNEDCLFLNVFTPQLDLPAKSLLPVLFFIHGGAFMLGSGSSAIYGPDHFIERDVILVTINYRLGILGFLSSNTSDAPGNAGLKDQVQALRWVKQNIRGFGGDPDRVTIYGESAGGASVHYLVLSPLAAGLFSGAIISSSTAQSGTYQGKPYDLVRRVCKLYGGPSGASPSVMVNFLRTIPAAVIALTFLEVATEEDFKLLVPGLPCRAVVEAPNTGEPAFFTEDPNDLLMSGRFNKVPMIIGSNFREGTLFFAVSSESDLPQLQRDLWRLVPAPVDPFLDDAERRRVGQQIRDVYTQGRPMNEETLPAVADIFGDEALLHGIQISTAWHARYVPVYRYHFVLDAFNALSSLFGLPPNVRVPGHGDELGYVFHARLLGDALDPGKRWKTGMERMVSFITNFCYHRNPTPNVTGTVPVLWPRRPSGKDLYLEIDDELTAKQDLYPERMQLLTKLFSRVHPVFKIKA